MKKSPLKAFVWLSGLLLCGPLSRAQVFDNDDAAREANFVTKVMQLDEFIHRFNNDTSSEIRRYYLAHHRPWNKSREQLIRSLFNYTTQNWDSVQLDHFIRRVIDPQRPDSLGFFRGHWYAEAACDFLYNAMPVEAQLILRMQINPNGTAQWVIAAVKPDFAMEPQEGVPARAGSVSRKGRFIQPAANETYFAELQRDFADKRRLTGLFEKRFFQRRYSGPFYQALLSDRIKFVAVKKLRYHCLQVPGWIFTVENFERPTRNSGWLITRIREAGAKERSEYIRKLLQE